MLHVLKYAKLQFCATQALCSGYVDCTRGQQFFTPPCSHNLCRSSHQKWGVYFIFLSLGRLCDLLCPIESARDTVCSSEPRPQKALCVSTLTIGSLFRCCVKMCKLPCWRRRHMAQLYSFPSLQTPDIKVELL